MKKLFRSITAALLIIGLSLRPGAGSPIQAPQSEARRAIVGAYDSAQLNGIVFITNDQNIFGLRFLTYRPGVAIEEAPRSYELGSCAPDGSYAQLSWRPSFDEKSTFTLRWSRVSDNAVVGRLSAPPNTRVAIEVYRPWSDLRRDTGWTAFSTQEDYRTIFGEQVNSQKAKLPLRNFLLQTDRLGAAAADYSDPQTMREILLKEGHVRQPGLSGSGTAGSRTADREVNRFAALSFDSGQSPSNDARGDSAHSIGFVAMIGDDFGVMQTVSNNLLQRLAAGILDQEEKKYENSRVKSGGGLGDSFTVLSRALNWSRIYQPEKQLEYAALGRRNDRDPRNSPVGWDSLFNAVVSSLINEESAAATVRLLLEGLTSDGRAPLRRYLQNPRRDEVIATAGRSMPPIGALCVWKIYLATQDLNFLAWAYPRLRQWNDWWITDRGDGQAWRDGNGDGLLEWGFDAELEQGQLGAKAMSNASKQRLAFSESGLEDRPQWLSSPTNHNQTEAQPDSGDEARYNDKTHTLEYSTVGLNALYALDAEILMMMASELGLSADAEKWRLRYDQIKKNVNEKLWSDEDGLYLNRHWDGRFSRRLSPENFYPLVAGLADDEKAKRMMVTLLDPKKFWGEYPLPSISRDDANFAAAAPGRGAIWAPMNFLVYLGLKRQGYNNEAAELSRKNLAIARLSMDKTGKFDDQFSSVDGRPISERSDEEGAPPRPYFFGLTIWPAVEELLNTDPSTGLSFGSLAPVEESQLERVNVSGAKLDVISGPKRTILRRNGAVEVECEAPVRLLAYHSADRAIGFVIETKERAQIQIPASRGRKITVSVNDKVLGSTSPGATATFKVSTGLHKVLIVK
ncbi:MAG TPA: trehalase family glycosidase [Blastocatellia bacterium]|nr:trehalase family glycosidase [Blastocatellia bacterium]